VVASNVAYFSAAGNEGRQAYDAPFRSGVSRAQGSISGTGALTFWGGLTHDFDPGVGVDDTQQFTLPSGGIITLSFQWDQPFGSVPGSTACLNDMDIYILNSAGTAVLAASSANNPGADPVEVVQYQNTTVSTQ